jgi:hypothetical protein
MGDVNPQESERTPLKPLEIAYAISSGFKGVLSDSWGFTSPISGLVRITYISEQIGSLSSHHTSDVL